MATSGYFYTSGWSDATCTDCYIFSWSLSSQNIEGNYSVISWSLKGAGGNDGYWTNVKEKYVTVNGSTQSNSTIQQTYNGTVAFSGTTTIYHNADGTKSFSASAGGAFYTYGSYNSTGSGTWELPAIPRASTISFGEFTIGSAGTITITPANSSFTHTISYHFGNKTGTIVTKTSNTSVSWTPPLSDFASQIPNDVRGYGSLTITTYSGSTTIGSKKYTMYCNLPASVVPTVGTITLTPVAINGQNILVQNKNKLQISVGTCSAGTGSSIKSYTFSGPGVSTTTTSTSITSSGNISSSGTLTYTVKVTDNRGRTASKTATIQCYEWILPSVKIKKVYRVAASGDTTENGSGQIIRLSYELNYASVNNNNSVTVTLYSKNLSGSYSALGNLTVSGQSGTHYQGGFSASNTYSIYLKITDSYSGSSNSQVATIFSQGRTFNVRPSGNGIALGKMAETDNLLDSKWAIKTDGDITSTGSMNATGGIIAGSSTQTSAPTNGICVHDIRSATVTPNSLGDKNANFYFQPINSVWHSILHVKGWSDNYAAWELAGNANNVSNDNSLMYRQGVGTTWGEWQTVFTNKNYTNYAAPKPVNLYNNSSGSTGTIKLSETAANFSYIEIFLYKDSASGWWSVKVPSPNGKVVQVGTQYYTAASSVGIQLIGKTVTISATTITPGTEFYMNFHSSEAKITALGGQTSIKIMRVDGYK